MTALRVDLHCHSTCSDGTLSPAALVERAAAKGVELLALTDHDETGGLAQARAAAGAANVRFVAGVEISVTWSGHTLHIVGLNIDAEHPEFAAGLASVRHGRLQRAQDMAADLERSGIAGALAGAQRYVTNPELVGRTHFARYLVEAGHARDTQAVFQRFLTPGRPGYVPHRWASLADAVRWIRASGGTAVIAHPGRYKLDNRERDALLGEFVEHGGRAIEVVTGSHAPDQFSVWARNARRFGLLASAGSDFHGPGESYRDIGAVPALPSGCDPVWTDW